MTDGILNLNFPQLLQISKLTLLFEFGEDLRQLLPIKQNKLKSLKVAKLKDEVSCEGGDDGGDESDDEGCDEDADEGSMIDTERLGFW